MAQARRAKALVKYRGQDIPQYVTNFSYTDNYDQTDDLRIILSDAINAFIEDMLEVEVEEDEDGENEENNDDEEDGDNDPSDANPPGGEQ